MIESKKCSKCLIVKTYQEFSPDKGKTTGLRSQCKECEKDRKSEYAKRYREINLSREKENKRRNTKIWKTNNPNKAKESAHSYYIKNRDKIISKVVDFNKKRLLTDSKFKNKEKIRISIYHAIKRNGYRKNGKLAKILGCSFEDLMEYFGVSEIKNNHIDHICPCSQAQNEEELIKLQHYTNLQLLPPVENIRKSNNPTYEGIELCRKLLGREWVYQEITDQVKVLDQ